ncbi:antiviral reverse transcriptase Drt3b [Lysobacter sp. Root983]|uniref:antiviral reverse transcriptase Drt3b n=1 Tax=Lysobacter sp. Root983 TaxID=1736613 RepID=UPI0009E85FAD|nr:antiviral reverse transcriptase Drt3b [Lysobacter sp. Root983]
MPDKKKRIDIRAPERALLTDTLPYEIPIYFTNANLAILAMQARLKQNKHGLHSKFLLYAEDAKATRPLMYEIRRSGQAARRLSLAHPISQHRISTFYEKYDHLISNACSRSSLSLRYPSRVATHYVDPRYADTSESSSANHADEDPAGFRDQSRWASTYFSYRDYTLSHKFFESEEFLELERRYSRLLKLDISRCFDSIYTHSIEWSMRGKDFSKDQLGKRLTTFESSFDSAIRHGNWDETHGILIGPEFSRIFAEIVLQSADRSILSSLDAGVTDACVIRRYVDDYYVFSNSQDLLDKVEEVIRKSLRDLNLHLNEHKKETLTRPFVSKVSVARSGVAEAIDEFFERTAAATNPMVDPMDPRDIERAKTSLIARLRRLSVELGTPYERFASFALSVLKRKLEEVRTHLSEEKPVFTQGHLARLSWLTAIMRSAQFLYSTDHRATTSVKLAAIYALTVEMSSSLGCARAPLERQILDGLRDVTMGAHATDADEVTRINHITSVDLILTEDRRIELQDIERYIGTTTDPNQARTLSAFQLIAILFLCRKRKRFSYLRDATALEFKRRILDRTFRPTKDATHALLLAEFIACPYLDADTKIDLIKHCNELVLGVRCTNKEALAIANEASWISFTDWSSTSDLATMLARKELTPAYE